MLQAFRQLNFPDQQTGRFQDNIAAALGPVLLVAFLDGVKVSAIVANGANVITHKLGRVPQGWIVTDLSASGAVTLYRSSPFTSTTITLTASGAATIALWVF